MGWLKEALEDFSVETVLTRRGGRDVETYWVWEYGLFEKNPKRQDSLNPETTLEVVKAADAQATIAALQARVKELQCVADEKCRCFLERAEQAEQQLTQRTAELEAAKRERDEWIVKWDEHDHYPKGYVTAQIQLREHVQAKLERVSADNKALDKWRADVTVALQRPEGAFFVDVPQHIKDLVKERDELRTLVLALPKVEGDVEVYHHESGLRHSVVARPANKHYSSFDTPEEAGAYAAILKHRQGMEG